MKTKLALLFCSLVSSVFFLSADAQQVTVSGSIRNSATNEVVPAASVNIKGTNIGAFSDERGNFRIAANFSFPVTLVITSIGFENYLHRVRVAGDNREQRGGTGAGQPCSCFFSRRSRSGLRQPRCRTDPGIARIHRAHQHREYPQYAGNQLL